VGSARLLWWIVVFASAALVCGAPPPPPPPPPPPEFSATAAWDHLRALAEIGPRVPGTPGAAAARAYLRAELEALGLEVTEEVATLADRGDGEPIEVANVMASIPAAGESPDLFLLAAGYDTTRFESFPFVGANSGASGAALLLDLARFFAENRLPYGLRIVFLGAEAPQAEIPPHQALWGSRLLVEGLRERGELERVRVAVWFDQVADADLTIARDLRSQRRYRDVFFEAARELGQEAAFPTSAPFESVITGHLAFWSANFRRVVAISDPRYGGSEPPGGYWHTEQDTLEHCSAQSLDAVGRVSRRALTEIATLLARVDRFARPVRAATPPDPPGGALEAEGEDAPVTAPDAETGGSPGGSPELDAEPKPPDSQEDPPGSLN
jgi:hypothetical protein